MLFTIDASVFVSSFNRREKDSADSAELISFIRKNETLLIEPYLLPVEVAASIRRACDNKRLAVEYSELLFNLPNVMFIPLDNDFSRKAVKIASEYGLRGADAIYVATAIQYGSILVSLDKEQLNRAPASVNSCTPKDARKYF